MTILFYKVGDNFFKGYTDAKNNSLLTGNKLEKCYTEYNHVDSLEKINNITLVDLINRYYEGEVYSS